MDQVQEIQPKGEFVEGTHYSLLSPIGPKTEVNEAYYGDLVICIHGILADSHIFDPMSQYLANKGFSVLSFDFIGRGHSKPSPNDKYGFTEHLNQFLSLLTHLNISSFHLIGHSMGGSFSAQFAALYPNKIKSLTLLAPAGLMGFFPLGLLYFTCIHSIVKRTLLDPTNQLDAWKKDFYYHEGKSLEIQTKKIEFLQKMIQYNPNALEAFWRSVLEFPLREIDSSVQLLGQNTIFPISLLWGKQDQSVSYSDFDKWTSYLSNQSCQFTHKTYDHASHAFFLEFESIVYHDIFIFLTTKQLPNSYELMELSK